MIKEEEQHAFISRVDFLLRFSLSFDQFMFAVWFVSASFSLLSPMDVDVWILDMDECDQSWL